MLAIDHYANRPLSAEVVMKSLFACEIDAHSILSQFIILQFPICNSKKFKFVNADFSHSKAMREWQNDSVTRSMLKSQFLVCWEDHSN